MRIGVISDIHMRNEDREAVSSELSEVVQRFNNKLEPDLIVCLGDMIYHEETVEEDQRNLKQVKKICSDLEAPVQYMLGNHDVENLQRSAIESIFEQEMHGIVEVEDETLVFLDSSAPHIPRSRGEITAEQFTFLEDILRTQNDIILFIHHPIHYRSLEDHRFWDVYPERAFCGNKKEINELIEEYECSVKFVVNGHIHDNNHTRHKDIDHITVNTFGDTRVVSSIGTHATIDIDNDVKVCVYEGDETVTQYEL